MHATAKLQLVTLKTLKLQGAAPTPAVLCQGSNPQVLTGCRCVSLSALQVCEWCVDVREERVCWQLEDPGQGQQLTSNLLAHDAVLAADCSNAVWKHVLLASSQFLRVSWLLSRKLGGQEFRLQHSVYAAR
jgi:hypothetical protein